MRGDGFEVPIQVASRSSTLTGRRDVSSEDRIRDVILFSILSAKATNLASDRGSEQREWWKGDGTFDTGVQTGEGSESALISEFSRLTWLPFRSAFSGPLLPRADASDS